MAPMSETDELDVHGVLADELPEPVYIVEQAKVRWINRAFVESFGWSREALLGQPFALLIAPEDLPAVNARYARRMAGEELSPDFDFELLLPEGRGRVLVRSTARFAVIAGREVNIGTLRDVSSTRATQDELARQVALVEEQREALMRLTAPAIEVWTGVIVMPLIGIYDEARSAQLYEDVVLSLSKRGASRLLLDLTGLSFRGPAVLSALVRIVRSSRLLGVRCALIGISAQLASTFVELDVDVSAFVVHATLADALRELLTQESVGPRG